jgi:hypothetical protein
VFDVMHYDGFDGLGKRNWNRKRKQVESSMIDGIHDDYKTFFEP